MFTGIIQKCGILQDREAPRGIMRLVVYAGNEFADAKIGDSISVNGACLSVVENRNGKLSFDLVKETQDTTTFGMLNIDSEVNLEKSIAGLERFSGHFVTGHIDGIGRVIDRVENSGGVKIRVGVKGGNARDLGNKGAVAGG